MTDTYAMHGERLTGCLRMDHARQMSASVGSSVPVGIETEV